MLTDEDYARAASQLGCEIAAIKAVAEVESGPYGAFLANGEPVILFERHLFSRLTKHKFDNSHPDLSNPVAGGYGKVSSQHARLAAAAELDRDAALQSASWGRFQVLGSNWQSLGYESLQAFVNAMYAGEAGHLDSFVRFVIANNLTQHLQHRDWAKFARGYNGPAFRKYKYDSKLAAAYAKHRSGP